MDNPAVVARHARGAAVSERGDESEEGISDRVKPRPSRVLVEAVSILRSARKLSCNGGGVPRRVTGCQRRSRERSESSYRARANTRLVREGENPSSLPHGPPKRVQRRRETTDPPIAPSPRGRDQAGRKPRARVQVQGESGWQKSVGRIAAVA